MIIGIGTDIVSVARMETALARHGEHFAQRILSSLELAEYAGQAHPARFLSKRFAAKEALSKACGQGLRHPVTLRNITVGHDELGKPAFEFNGELQEFLAGCGMVRHHLSLSDERDHAVAFVILEGKD